MADKSVVINKLVTFDAVYTVKDNAVEKINFFSSLEPYNKNKCFEGPCYTVHYEKSNVRHIIPLKEVKGVEVLLVGKEAIENKPPAEAFVYESATKKGE